MPETSVRPENVGSYEPPSLTQRAFSSILDAGAKTISIMVGLGLILGGALGTMGMKVFGPRDEIAAVEKRAIQRDSIEREALHATNARVMTIEATQSDMARDIADIKGDQRISTFIMCADAKMRNSPLMPEGCTPVLKKRGRP